MQGKWLLPSWLFGWFPSFPNSKKQTNYQLQRNQGSKGAHTFHINGDLGSAWTATLQFPILIIPWLASSKAECKRIRELEKRPGVGNSNQTFCNLVVISESLHAPLYLACMHIFSLDFSSIFSKPCHLCFPAVVALSSAVIPPFENLPKLLPSQVDEVDIESSPEDNYPQQEVASCDITTSLIHLRNQLKDEVEQIIIEPKTGFQFPVFLCYGSVQSQPFCSNMQVLAGVGLKNVTVMKLKSIKIYAFGFYIKPDMLKGQFSEKYGAMPPEDLKRNPLFFEELLRHDLGMTVRLMVHYKGLKMNTVKSAFDGSLRNRLKKIKGVENDEGLDIFNSYFSKDMAVPQGTIIDFQRLPGGEFRTAIDGKLIGSIHSHDFCRAFFDIYIGNPPVSLKTKEDICETLSQIMRSS